MPVVARVDDTDLGTLLAYMIYLHEPDNSFVLPLEEAIAFCEKLEAENLELRVVLDTKVGYAVTLHKRQDSEAES